MWVQADLLLWPLVKWLPKNMCWHIPKKNILVTDRSKFKKKASYIVGSFRNIDMLVTNPLTKEERNMVRAIKQIVEV